MTVTLDIVPACIGETCRDIPHNWMNERAHWALKSKWNRQWYEHVYWAVLEHRRKIGKMPLICPTITVNFYGGRYDQDGAYSAAKVILDGLVRAGVIEDDAPKYIRKYEVLQPKGKRRTEIVIEI